MINNSLIVEQLRRWLTRTTYDFCHGKEKGIGDHEVEQWHENKAKELIIFIKLTPEERAEATKLLNISSCDSDRRKLCGY
jgi:hypothetical protein